ncbi:hypothetical protein AVEN_214377-1 [Araneus ventricosus]|uniref:Uncharacterized protein n=1 Tax=Araneus ventricosus TaxID=182803 RepID=A0A4Y2HNU3_ARAVE|nr:hypothetical protein AVEN_214377-1 [Araneus ventricosus]
MRKTPIKGSISAHAQTSRIENVIAQPKQLFSHLRSWRQRVGDPKRNEVSGHRKLQVNQHLIVVLRTCAPKLTCCDSLAFLWSKLTIFEGGKRAPRLACVLFTVATAALCLVAFVDARPAGTGPADRWILFLLVLARPALGFDVPIPCFRCYKCSTYTSLCNRVNANSSWVQSLKKDVTVVSTCSLGALLWLTNHDDPVVFAQQNSSCCISVPVTIF